jgi:hypothetical protein
MWERNFLFTRWRTLSLPHCINYCYKRMLPSWSSAISLPHCINYCYKRMLPCWSSGMAVPLNITAPSVACLVLTRKSNGNANTSHEVTQCTPTELMKRVILSRPVQLNVIADHLATEALVNFCAASKTPESIFVMAPSISRARKNARILTNESPEYELWVYMQQRNNSTDHIYDSISWTADGSANSILTDIVRTFVIKLNHGCLPVRVRERG